MADERLLDSVAVGDEFDLTIDVNEREEQRELTVADVTDFGPTIRVSFRGANMRWWQVGSHVFVTTSDDELIDPDGRELGLIVEEQLEAQTDQ